MAKFIFSVQTRMIGVKKNSNNNKCIRYFEYFCSIWAKFFFRVHWYKTSVQINSVLTLEMSTDLSMSNYPEDTRNTVATALGILHICKVKIYQKSEGVRRTDLVSHLIFLCISFYTNICLEKKTRFKNEKSFFL